MERRDVAVVGAGPAGLAAAASLTRGRDNDRYAEGVDVRTHAPVTQVGEEWLLRSPAGDVEASAVVIASGSWGCGFSAFGRRSAICCAGSRRTRLGWPGTSRR